MCEGRFVRMHGENSDAVSRDRVQAAEQWRENEAYIERGREEVRRDGRGDIVHQPARRDVRRGRELPVREPAQLPEPRGIPVEFPERIEVEIPQLEPARRKRW